MNKLYSNNKTKVIDRLAAEYLGVDSFELMQLAGAAVYEHLKGLSKILVVTGPGNNGGDGFVIAELARREGQAVKVLALCPVDKLQGDARLVAEQYHGELLAWETDAQFNDHEFDVVVDAIFGTGLSKEVKQPYADVIAWLNQQVAPVIAVDIPSGLNGSTGKIEGMAVKASRTVSILAPKTGLHSLDGKDCCGEVLYESLGVAESAYQGVQADGCLLNVEMLQRIPDKRQHNSHKGQFGHVITAGGQTGMLGAVILAARAVLKSGAGSTTVITEVSHSNLLPLHAPEIMSCGYNEQIGADLVFDLLQKRPADVLLLGMGLGQSPWSKSLFKNCLATGVPLVVDADGLNLLSRSPKVPDHLQVITPHPKEAAVLLNCEVTDIQNNRWQAVNSLAQKFNCVAILKGSGTLIADGDNAWCCPYGNANLATAGTGDVLAGMVAGLMGQGFDALQAAQLAVVWHAVAGEDSRFGLSMTASDLLNTLHEVWP